MDYLWIMIGSALGGAARFWVTGFVAEQTGGIFPWGTVLINVSGSFLIGFFGSLTGAEGRFVVGESARLFVMIGLCGGFTTFSSFSLQTLNLMRQGEMIRAGGNIALSVVFCLLAVWLGHVVAVAINQMKGA
ncbi:CrcB protein [Methylocella silvestris BL2]|uniref:Fluoride-specific ion channel FluC n=2 Tax=Methylocella silvestris TaxID=199596 RepID=FLUC_METSB|nr:RecName: Full=Fluoride-specific ion channel FluC [Methylocella silvestris BL2]ACK49944.1 CrcB protein [Methylocella silvestris BL2]